MATEKQEISAAAAGPAAAAQEVAVDIEKKDAAATDGPTDEEAAKAKARPEREAAVKDYIRVFSYATKWDIFAYFAASIASIGAGITLPLMNIIFGQLVGQFTGYFAPIPTVTQEQFEAALNKQGLLILALFLGRLTLNYINKFAFRMIGIRLSSAIRLHYLKALFAQTIHVLDSMPSGAAAGTITSTANVLQLGISEKLGVFIEFMGTVVAAIIIAFTYNWELTLVTSTVILFIFFVLGTLLPFIIKGHTRMTKAETMASAVASESFGSIRMIAACGAEDRITQKYATFVQEAKKHGQFTAPLIALQFGLIVRAATQLRRVYSNMTP
jgi:ATP-binding cassette, subfamily B (MDR/TAP), member 1